MGLASFGAGCGRSVTSPSPSAATPPVVQVIARISPVPLPTQAYRMGGASRIRYRCAGEVTFSDVGGNGGRITQLQLTFLSDTGQSETLTLAVALDLPPSGTVKHSIREAVEVSSVVAPVRMFLNAFGTSSSGSALVIAPVEVALAVTPINDAPDEVFAGAGDIAVCGSPASHQTARLLDRIAGHVFTLGDHVYPNGAAEHFANCYEPSWGRHRARTFAAPGNHDWEVLAAAPYFSYFGQSAGPGGLGYYSFDLGAWHVLSLNSNIPAGPGSPQYEWARADLAAAGAACTLAMWHHPLFSSGPNGNNGQMREMWRLLHKESVEVILAGHDHDYERFAPQDADGRFDPRGVRQFVVGTGGVGLYNWKTTQPNSEVRDNQTWGVLRLTLRASNYDWEFVPIEGQSFRDVGSDSCR